MDTITNSNLKICFPGLNQFYYINKDNLEYNSISLENKIPTVTFVTKNNSKLFFENNHDIIFYNENPNFLEIDINIIKTHQEFEFNKQFLLEEELIQNIQKDNPKNYIILNDNIIKLLKFHNLGCWTILLTTQVYSHLDKNSNTNIYKTIQENLEFLNQNEIEKFFQFSTNNFYHLNYYYNLIEEINKNCENGKADLHNFNLKMKNLNPIKVCLFTRLLMRLEEFKKQRFYISNEKVLYVSHLGGDDIKLNLPFDCVLAKTVEVDDLHLYDNLLNNINKHCTDNKIWMVNYLPTLIHFVEKDLMGNYLNDFSECQEIKNLVQEFKEFSENSDFNNLKLIYPKSENIKLQHILDENNFKIYLKKNNFTFPLIVKYKGKSNYFKHLVTFIFNEESLNNYINSLIQIEIPLEEKLNTILVIQTFIQHGGKVLKFYRINKESYLDYRSSLPDLNEELKQNFPEGFWTFKTIELEKGKYKDVLDKINIENEIKSVIEEDKKNLKFAYRVVESFEKYSKFTLFGLDLLFNKYDNSFYIVDCNSLPGYKIKGDFSIDEKMRQHFISYLKIKEKIKV